MANPGYVCEAQNAQIEGEDPALAELFSYDSSRAMHLRYSAPEGEGSCAVQRVVANLEQKMPGPGGGIEAVHVHRMVPHPDRSLPTDVCPTVSTWAIHLCISGKWPPIDHGTGIVPSCLKIVSSAGSRRSDLAADMKGAAYPGLFSSSTDMIECEAYLQRGRHFVDVDPAS